jgi:cytochrome c oxidase cbb3-type subunit 3
MMRITTLNLIAAGLLAAGQAALAEEVFSGSPSEPASSRLLNSQVGGTHIPLQAEPDTYENPYAGEGQAIAEGGKLFIGMNCAGCHAPQGGGGMGPPLSDEKWIYGGRPEQIYLTILQGRPNGMPAFGKALPEASIWKLVAYIETLKSLPAPANPSARSKSSE